MAHVLIADDSPTVRTLLRGWLESAGHIVQEAPDGERALKALRAARQPMVVLLDYLMPGMTGEQVLQQALKQGYVPPRYAYVIISGLSTDFPPSFTELLRRLSIQILPKPFDQETVQAVVAFVAARMATTSEPAASKRRFPFGR
jgi:CheY-like chemotaxis protein